MLQIKLIAPGEAGYEDITRLLPLIFPKEELVPRNIADDNAPYLACYDGEVFIGFAQIFKKPDIQYLRYIAILPEFRSRGYGGKILDLLLVERGKVPLSLDIEPLDETAPNYELRLRRFNFYRKHGMVDSGYVFLFGGCPFTILSTGESSVPEIMKRYCASDRRYPPGYMQIVKKES